MTIVERKPMKDLHLMPAYIYRIVWDAPVKWLFAALSWLLTFVAPTTTVQNLCLGAFAMMLIDTLTGIWAARATKQQITSARFGRLLTKMCGSGILILIFAITCQVVDGLRVLQPYVISAIATAILFTELVSNVENLKRMGIGLPHWVMSFLEEHAHHSIGERTRKDDEGGWRPNS